MIVAVKTIGWSLASRTVTFTDEASRKKVIVNWFPLSIVAVTAKTDHMRDSALDPLDFLAIDALLDDEERAIRDTVRTFVQEKVLPDVGDWFEQGILPRELISELGKLGLYGMIARTELAGGTLHIRTREGRGVAIRAVL